MTTIKAISSKEAEAINERLGLAYDDEQRTFWAYDETHDEIYDFDSMRERDYFIATINERNEIEAANELAALERDANTVKALMEKFNIGLPEAIRKYDYYTCYGEIKFDKSILETC